MSAQRVLAVSVLLLAWGLGAKEDVEFKAEALLEGSLVQMSVQSDLRFFSNNLRASAHMMAEMFVSKVDNGVVQQVKMSYGDFSSDGTLEGFGGNKNPVEGKVYVVERTGGALVVTNALGETPPKEEVAIVEKDLAFLGRTHPIATMLNGQRLNLGDRPNGEDVLRQLLEERLEPYKIGKVKDVKIALVSLGEYGTEKTARFALRVETGESTVAYDANFQLNGELVVAIPSGRPIAIRLDGPLNAKVKATAKKEELRGKSLRGTFSLTVLTQTHLGEREQRQYTNGDDWNFIMGGGKRFRR